MRLSAILIVLTGVLAAAADAQFNRDYQFGVANEIEDFSSQVSVALDDGGFLTVDTERTTAGDRNAMLLRVDSAGNTVWARSYGNGFIDERGHSLTLSNDDAHALFTGSAAGLLWIVRVRLIDGVPVWSRIYGTANQQESGHVIQAHADSTGTGYLVAGTVSQAPNRAIYFLRITEAGLPVYMRRYDTDDTFADQPTAMHQRADRVWLTGIHREDGEFDSLFVLALRTATGDNDPMVWYDHPNTAVAKRLPMLAPADEGFMAAYSVREAFESPRVAALRIDDQLDPLWERHYTASGPGLPLFPPSEAGWGVSISRTEDDEFAIGAALTGNSLSAFLTIDAGGSPVLMRHFSDLGFTDPGAGVVSGDTVSPMASDDQGFLLKNHVPMGISLTRIDLAGMGPCQIELDVDEEEVEVERRETPYEGSPWGRDEEWDIDSVTMVPVEIDCP